MTETTPLLAGLLADEGARRQLAAALARDIETANRTSFWARVRIFLAGASSALVVLLAFLIPSLQDQWDRFETRGAVTRYAEIGDRLMQDGHFESAEQAYVRAVELAGNQRHDLIEKQLRARVMRVYENPDWRGPVAADISEADFVYLLETERATGDKRRRAATLAAFGAFLAGKGRLTESESRLKESIALDAANADAHIHLGNVYADLGRTADAEREYRAALAVDPREPSANYDLGLLLLAQRRAADAEPLFRAALVDDPRNIDTHLGLIESLEAQGRRDEALATARTALQSSPDSKELRDAIARLQQRAK